MAFPDLFRTAVTAATDGDTQTAQRLLQELLQGNPRHELGWYWLGKVTHDPEEKIHALQRALLLNPHNTEAHQALQAAQESRHINIYQKSVQLYRQGNNVEARNLLLMLIQQEPTHAKAWFGLSYLSTQLEEKIVTLEQGLRLNPTNGRAQTQLTQLINQQPNLFTLAQQYEAYRQYDAALTLYQKIAKQAPEKAVRHKAKTEIQRLKQVKKSARPIALTSENATLLRLSAGPVVVYLLLILIHAGLNPLHLPAILLLGLLGVGLGSIVVAGTANTPHHAMWQRLLGIQSIADSPTRFMLTALGLLLIFIPFLTVFLAAYGRLLLHQP
jgi:tetratricopeptide (TPR) repeat protein